jgi:hypothetical protein
MMLEAPPLIVITAAEQEDRCERQYTKNNLRKAKLTKIKTKQPMAQRNISRAMLATVNEIKTDLWSHRRAHGRWRTGSGCEVAGLQWDAMKRKMAMPMLLMMLPFWRQVALQRGAAQ